MTAGFCLEETSSFLGYEFNDFCMNSWISDKAANEK